MGIFKSHSVKRVKTSPHSSCQKGGFYFTRNPQGLSAAGDIFNQKHDQIVEDLEWILKIVDDILIFAPTYEELYKRIRILLHRMRAHNVKLSRKKFKIGSSLRFAGYFVSDKGLSADPDKIAALKKFPAPKNISELRSFLGLANQLSTFVPDFAHTTVCPTTTFEEKTWHGPGLQIMTRSFEQANTILSSPSVVKPFDPSLKTTLLTDASRLHGIGYALVQHGKDNRLRLVRVRIKVTDPNSTKIRHSRTGMHGTQMGNHRKTTTTYEGMPHFDVITDHRPLLGIFRKNLHEINNPRLQRFREALLAYTFEVKWVEGKRHLIADALSRAPVFKSVDEAADPTLAQVFCSNRGRSSIRYSL